ncbi:hypothetical protein SAMN04515674_10640 [Pseudarcicella hirudinis]|uniref:Uncharacterized protein n=1 Tax=Pseudarcicella hirudinis TaxID=1079859 RepID=A0A1I5TGV2_9BACT|nr:hypothetical protein SAMN04515674_10640 [Pseudarcicella hirudinis]
MNEQFILPEKQHYSIIDWDALEADLFAED